MRRMIIHKFEKLSMLFVYLSGRYAFNSAYLPVTIVYLNGQGRGLSLIAPDKRRNSLQI